MSVLYLTWIPDLANFGLDLSKRRNHQHPLLLSATMLRKSEGDLSEHAVNENQQRVAFERSAILMKKNKYE